MVLLYGRLGKAVKAVLCGLYLLPVLMAAACGGAEPTPSPTAATAAAATPAPTATPVPTHTPLPSPTARATLTPAPTATPTPAPPPASTTAAAFTATPTDTAVPTATADDLARFQPPDPETGAAGASEALIAGQVFQLEIAATPAERARGLMGQQRIPDDYAMLFVYNTERQLSFWMKGTLIPLDILFLDSNGAVIDVQTMTPQPGAADSDLIVYTSARPAQYALEMNAGLAQTLGVEPGSVILFD